MSLRGEALKRAKENAKNDRQAAQEREAARISNLEKWVSERTGMPARWLERRELAVHAYVEAGFQRSVDGVKMVWVDILAIDDVEIAAEPARGYSDRWSAFKLVHRDAERGYFLANDYSTLQVHGHTRKTPEEVQGEFIRNLARAMQRSAKHPAITAAEKGSRCPTCGKDW